LRKKDSSFSLSSEKSRKERKPKATRIIILLHQFNCGIYTDHPDFSPIEAFQQEQMGTSVLKWGEGVFLQVSQQALYTFARYPERYAEQ
jgi:hypothetical protein